MKLRVQSRYALTLLGLVTLVVGSLSASLLIGFRHTEETTHGASEAATRQALMRQLENDARSKAELLAMTITKPLYFFDIDAIGNAVEAVLAIDGIEFVHVIDANDRVIHDGSTDIASFGKGHHQLVPGLPFDFMGSATWMADGVFRRKRYRWNRRG